MIRIGCAGWTLPRADAARFPSEGSHLERYARVFSCSEINSTFHRPHRESTFARWAASVPDGFRFSLKMAKTITHGEKLVSTEALLDEFFEPATALGNSIGCLLVQLPPKLAFDAAVAETFLEALAERCDLPIAIEPRHASWLTPAVDDLLSDWHVARVAADPPRGEGGALPGGWQGMAYYRLHGSPRTYYSSYDDTYLRELAARLAQHDDAWCIFDNTAGQAAVGNALQLAAFMEGKTTMIDDVSGESAAGAR